MNPTAQAGATNALEHAIATLGETGLQVAAVYRGEVVVDAIAGIADPNSGRPVDHDTLFTMFSMSKGVTATIIHRLVEQGVLDYDLPLAHWWPAIGQHGKGGITVRHTLSHRAGLPRPKNLPIEHEPVLALTGRNLEEATPDWAPGASMSYHGFTFGTLLGRLVEEATGLPFPEVVRREVSRPLNIPDLYCGVPEDPSVTDRIAFLHPAGAPDPATGLTPMTDDERAPIQTAATKRNAPEARAGVIPAGGMISNARTLVQHYAAMRTDGYRGQRLLTPATIAEATVAYRGEDGNSIEWTDRMGLGYALGAGTHTTCGVKIVAPWADAFGHTGLGGSLAMYCPSQDLAVAMTKNALMPGRLECHTWDLVLQAICRGLGVAYHD